MNVPPSGSSTLYVPTTIASVQRAVNLLSAGNTVFVKTGAYATETVNVPVDNATANVEAGATGFSFTLDSGIANFNLAGAGAVDVTGNNLANNIGAKTGNNVINAGAGAVA